MIERNFLGLFFFVCVGFCKIIQVQILTRHCDRAPYYHTQIPNDPIDWREKFGLDYENLTPLGEQQCFQVGQKLHDRYLKEGSINYIEGISDVYQSYNFQFSASDTNRTVRTCFSVGEALFPVGNIIKENGTNVCTLPNCTQSFPISTKQVRNDNILKGYHNCNYWNDVLCPQIDSSTQWLEFLRVNEKRMQEIVDKLGFKDVNVKKSHQFITVFDLVNCQYTHDILNMTKLNITKEDVEFVIGVNDKIRYLMFQSNVIGTRGGGALVELMYKNIHEAIDKYGKRDYVKYHQSCAHDLTLMSFFSATRLIEDHIELQKLPDFGASLAVELHLDEEEINYSVKVVYLPSFKEDFVEYKFVSLHGQGCDVSCEIGNFDSIITSAFTLDWCSDCSNYEADFCIINQLESKKINVIILYVVVAILVLLIILLVIAVFALVWKVLILQKSNKEYLKMTENGGYGNI